MNTETRQYLRQLLAGWPQGQPDAAPVSLAPSVLEQARGILMSHHVTNALAALVPAGMRNTAWQAEETHWRGRTDFLLLELERVLPGITWDACRPVVLKGAALAGGYYPDSTWRPFLDLDILVPGDQVEEVCRRLEADGYHPYDGPLDPIYYDRHHLHRIMTGPQGSLLEVHWDLTLPGSAYRFDVDGVFERAVEIPLGRTTMLAASGVDQVLHSVYQHIADGFVDLKRVLDLKLILPTLREEDWLYLMKESERTGMAAALKTLLYLVKDLAALDLPPGMQSLPGPGPVARRTLKGLDLTAGLLERRAVHFHEYSIMLHFLLVPGHFQRLLEYGRFLWPDEAQLLVEGFQHDQLPGPGPRVKLLLYNSKLFLQQAARALGAWIHG